MAAILDHRHRTILENIDHYIVEFKELGRIPFETEKGNPLPQGGFSKSVRFAMLNEDQCYFLLTLMRNNDRVVRSKLLLVKAFRDARTQLIKRDLARTDGKEVRKMETSAISELVEYAKSKGSKSSEKYYIAITKMTNKLLGIDGIRRDDLDHRKLSDISVLEKIVSNAVSDGISAGLPYKDIYRLAEIRCKIAIPAIGTK